MFYLGIGHEGVRALDIQFQKYSSVATESLIKLLSPNNNLDL